MDVVSQIMDERERKLRRVALKCADFARQLSYHRALSDYREDFGSNFWIYTYNNAIDLAVLDWFHLFGYHNDDLHWKKVVDDVDAFREGLFAHIDTTENEWKSYREEIKNYRDKDVAHIEVRPVSHVPEMSTALCTAHYYYHHVLQELSRYSDYGRWPKDLIEYHERSLEQTRQIAKAAYEATKHLGEEVY